MSHPQFGRFNMKRTCQQVCNVLRVLGFLVCLLSAVSLAACAGVQSSLAPAGQAAERIAALFWWMTAGAALVWLGIMILAIYATKADGAHRQQQAQRIILLGAVVPTIVLAGLLGYGLHLLPQLISPPPEGTLRIKVYGEQWWWRVRYEPVGRPAFELANEIRLPVAESVEFLLHSHNVIHSFWIPSLGGKVDLIPGRVNRLTLHPTKTGVFRGTCAEYCGAGHATMAFNAIVLSREEFHLWLAQQSEPVRESVAGGNVERQP